MPSKTLYLIDGHALCYRSFYALQLTTSQGQPTNAVYGFIQTIRKLLREYKPEYLAVCFDSKAKTKRQELFADYKIQRPSMPEGLSSQIPVIKDMLKAYGLAICEKDGYEADDLIATFAKKFDAEGYEVVVVTDDKDMYQLMNQHIHIFSIRNDKIMSPKDVQDKWGFEANRIVDYLSLAGDQSDNIPGVKGIGEVTASKLIQEYGDLKTILKNVEHIKSPSVKAKLTEQKDMALLSHELATLDMDVPVEIETADIEVKEPNKTKLYEMFRDLEFKKIAQEFEVKEAPAAIEIVLNTENDAKVLIEKIRKTKQFNFLFSDEHLFISFDKNQKLIFPLTQAALFASLFGDENILKVTYQLKDAIKLLRSYNIGLQNPAFDVLIAGGLLGNVSASSRVSDLVWRFLKPEAVASHDEVSYLSDLHTAISRELNRQDLIQLYRDIELPLSFVLAGMEIKGVCLDLDWLKKLSQECELKINELTKTLYSQAGEEFNLNSPKQLGVILFEKLKLPVIKRTKTGYSTDEEVLTKLSDQHAFPALLLEYRQLAKLKSTYMDALPNLVNQKTQCIHTCFEQMGAETGRLSSKQPNLQNIPIRTELGRKIRAAFIASSKDHVLFSADYSQIELRILAHLSGDETLKEAFINDEDIHKYTASLIFDVKEADVTYHMRDTAKRINFGIAYGMSAFGLSKDLGISASDAQKFIAKYFERYPKVKEYMDNTIKLCEEQGYVTTLLNRRRYLPDIKSKNNAVRQFAQRQAINTPVQGAAADLMKLAMIKIDEEIQKNKMTSRMTITVHDEIVLDVPNNEVDDMKKLVKKTMENCLTITVPIKVSVKKGKNWLDMQEI
jgi:DNA polymerase-1